MYIYIKLHAIAWKKKCKKDNNIKIQLWKGGEEVVDF